MVVNLSWNWNSLAESLKNLILSNLPNLTELNLGYLKSLTNLNLLSNLTNLTELYVGFCASLANLDGLSNLPNLTGLTLSRCESLTEVQMKNLRKALPKTNIDIFI